MSQAEQRGGVIAVVCPVASRRSPSVVVAFLTECGPGRAPMSPYFFIDRVSFKKLSVEEETVDLDPGPLIQGPLPALVEDWMAWLLLLFTSDDDDSQTVKLGCSHAIL